MYIVNTQINTTIKILKKNHYKTRSESNSINRHGKKWYCWIFSIKERHSYMLYNLFFSSIADMSRRCRLISAFIFHPMSRVLDLNSKIYLHYYIIFIFLFKCKRSDDCYKNIDLTIVNAIAYLFNVPVLTEQVH